MANKTSLSEKIAKLPSLPRGQLLELWSETFRKSPPPALSKQLIAQILAYRWQEKAYGGLSPDARRRLSGIAASKPEEKSAVRFRDSELPPGTLLIRSWKGSVHEVVATESGYEYLGCSYSHLSPIAREITGTNQSGQRFFGLKKRV